MAVRRRTSLAVVEPRRLTLAASPLLVLAACNTLWGVDELRFESAASDGGFAVGGDASGHGGRGGAGAGGSSTTTAGSGGAGGSAGFAGAGGHAGAAGSAGGGPAPVELVIPAVDGLTGDGFLASPSLCGDEVLDSYGGGSLEAIVVGVDPPCGVDAIYRAFIRFDLGAWNQLPEPMELLSVTLWLYYLDRASPTVGANLYGIDDFGALGEADWGLTVRRGFGEFVNPGTVEDQWIARDVLPALLDAVGESHVAFELQYADESQDPGGQSRWYKFTAADSGEAWAPRLVIMYVPG